MDIVERLRQRNKTYLTENGYTEISYRYSKECEDAADEIERLREALKQIRDFGPMTVDDQRWRIANAALQQKESE